MNILITPIQDYFFLKLEIFDGTFLSKTNVGSRLIATPHTHFFDLYLVSVTYKLIGFGTQPKSLSSFNVVPGLVTGELTTLFSGEFT
jgi:hypothetical protein